MPQVKLVICGSAVSWMIKNVVNAKGGLYNRLTEVIHLKPFTLGQAKEMLESKGITYEMPQVLELYMAFGGIPFYLNLLRRGESPAMAISRLCFGGGVLQSEFETLFKALFDSSENHEKIIRCISSKRSGLTRSEIIDNTGLPSGGRIDQWLNELIQSGFVAPIEVADGKKTKSRFRIIDEFVLFHLKWMDRATKGPLGASSDGSYFILQKSTASFEAWAGLAFEGICFKHIPQIKRALGISHVRSIARTWQKRFTPISKKVTARSSRKERAQVIVDRQEISRGAQIDLLFDRDDGIITLCEIKYTKDPFVITKDYASILENKQKLYKSETATTKSIFLAMVTTMGLSDNEYARRLVTNSVTVSDLFAVI
jgi:hypothetical protein